MPFAEQDHGSDDDADRKAEAASGWHLYQGFQQSGLLQRQQRSRSPAVSEGERRKEEINCWKQKKKVSC